MIELDYVLLPITDREIDANDVRMEPFVVSLSSGSPVKYRFSQNTAATRKRRIRINEVGEQCVQIPFLVRGLWLGLLGFLDLDLLK